jgi:hypothetical protein
VHNLGEIENMHEDDLVQLTHQYLPGVMIMEPGHSLSHATRVGRGILAMKHHGIAKELKRFVL